MYNSSNLFSVGNFPVPKLVKLFAPIIDRVLSLKQLGDLYQKNTAKNFENPLDFVKAIHQTLNVKYDVALGSLDKIPKTGPLVVVANHPFGGIEATLLLELLSAVRPDVKFMANYLLGKIPQTKDFCIYVDPFGQTNSSKANLKPLKETISWVKKGGALCIFPSGTVSHFHWKRKEVCDPAWSPTISRIIRSSGAVALPVFFPGRNDLFFQLMGMIHPLLRTTLLARELYNKRNKEIRIKIGNVIPNEKLQTFASDEDMIAYLRLRTYILGNEQNFHSQVAMQDLPEIPSKRKTRVLAPVVEAVDPILLNTEVNALPSKNLLLNNGELSVYRARYKQIPNIMREIGRLREITFRKVHEGTGKEIDLDNYDHYYIHLFIWNKSKKEIVGAYRLAKADRILKKLGAKGLYSSTLFDYKPGLLEQMGPALELGRSFIRSEYQKNYTSLLLLWKGIGAYVLANPRYKVLFGPVSINNEYDSISRELISMFLKANNFHPELAKLIKAKNPMGRTKILGMDIKSTSVVVKDLKDVTDLLHDIEARHKTVPVLLKQYLKVGGKMLGFNVDTSFGDVLDGLIYVDLLETEPNLLDKILGKEGSKKFLAFHQKSLDS